VSLLTHKPSNKGMDRSTCTEDTQATTRIAIHSI